MKDNIIIYIKRCASSFELGIQMIQFFFWLIGHYQVGGAEHTPPRPAHPGISTRCKESFEETSLTNVLYAVLWPTIFPK